MELQSGQIFDLLDAQQRLVGHIKLEGIERDMLCGSFEPGPAFSEVKQLFLDFEEAVNSQALGAVDALDRAIAALGLQLRRNDSLPSLAARDVQIWSDGAISLRVLDPSRAGTDGEEKTGPFRQAVRE